jgi:hypothetical protein
MKGGMLRRPLFHCRKLALLFALLATAVCAPRLACADESSTPTAPSASSVERARAANEHEAQVTASAAPPPSLASRSPASVARRVYLAHCSLLI